MPLQIIRNDITTMAVDAIVNPTNTRMRPGGGTDAAIHAAAGKELAEACRKAGTLKPGFAVLSDGFRLPCKYIIHTVGPRWYNGCEREKGILQSCYRNSLLLAAENGIHSIAFPVISAGSLRFPKEQAIYIAIEEIRAFLKNHEMDVTLVLFDQEAFRLGSKISGEVKSYIDRNYVDSHTHQRKFQQTAEIHFNALPKENPPGFSFESAPVPMQAPAPPMPMQTPAPPMPMQAPAPPMPYEAPVEMSPNKASRPAKAKRQKKSVFSLSTLESRMAQLDESFSEMLLRKIDESGMTDAQCYTKAGIDRRLFSKIRSDSHYKPSKTTALAFIIALELPLDEANDMLRKAGFALSRSSKFDVIVEYFLQSENYNLYQINQALFEYDQALIGV